MQILINILQTCSLYLIVAISYAIIYFVAKFFHIAHAAVITIAPYFVFLFSQQCGLSLFVALPLAILFAVLLGLITEQFVYKPLRKYNVQPFTILIASLGLYVVLQNIISMVWGDATLSIRVSEVKIGLNIFGAYITAIQIITIAVSATTFISSIIFFSYTNLGMNMRAVSSNTELANIFGISSNQIIFWAFALGSAFAAIAGILVAFDTDMRPTIGFSLFLYGVVAIIIGGIGSHWGLLFASLLLATAQHLGAYYIDSKWMDAIAYLILIIFLIFKPFGFSGQRLKKIEL